MTNSLNQPDGSKNHAGGETKSSVCPVCGGSDLQDITEVSHPVCSACAYVVGPETETPTPLDEDDPSSTREGESWDEYYSVTNSTEQQVASAFECLEGLGDELMLSDEVRLQVADVYASASETNLTDGRSTQLMIAAAICIGGREVEKPRPIERVAKAAEIQVDRVKGTVRLYQQKLNRGYTGISAAKYVPYLCADIGVDEAVENQAIKVIERFENQDERADMHPAGIAGAAVYFAADNPVTQRQIATVAGVTSETIRVRLNDLREVIST